MDIQKKHAFKYATLYDAEKNIYNTSGQQDGLVMGEETAKRFEENDDCAVTICCITYKHEEFIRDALDSFLMQKTNFKYKIFVGEDHGPDGTADIVREYAEKYPDIIVPFLREENMGAQANLIDLCQHANSPYIAFCEGDDYWVDEYKLQKQYDYMQANPHLRVAFTKAEISAPDDWFLRGWFKADKQGRLIFPDCEPAYKKHLKDKREIFSASDCIWVFPAHTATVFYRWNYDVEIPDWYYTGIVGDHPIFLMQLGEGYAGFLQDVTAVYRRSNVGVYMSADMDEHFMKTRVDHVRWMSGMLEWYKNNLTKYPRVSLENRVKHESMNYLNTAIKLFDYDAILEYFQSYPQAARLSLIAYLSFYKDSQAMVRTYTWKGYCAFVRNKKCRSAILPFVWVMKLLNDLKAETKLLNNLKAETKKLSRIAKKAIKRIISFFFYWIYSCVPKTKNLWVITGFRGKTYLDNTKYFYEYIVENHPEIDIYWLAGSAKLYEELSAKNLPVCKVGTWKYRYVLSHAEVAITDHYVVSDYDLIRGFNDKIKIVQLWHGVGFKSMGDANGVRNTSERGARYSQDILVNENDGFFKRIIKRIKYFFVAPYRELFEKYFMMVCPGQERLEMIADVWHVPEESRFMAGHPRDILMYNTERQTDPVKVMYAPTYRFDFKRETAMVEEFLEVAPEVQALMEEINGEFYLRMHPHTWRNYKGKIKSVLKHYDRILLHEEPDIYEEIGTFSIMISDYSSIALDFALLDRPAIFHGADYEWFVKNEAGFNLDFPSVIPGPMTANWAETLERVREYHADPNKDSELRKEKLKYFFDKSVNDVDNSKRIVQEIKRRIGLN